IIHVYVYAFSPAEVSHRDRDSVRAIIPLTSYLVFLRHQRLMFNIDAAAWEDRKYNEESRFPAHVEIRSPTATALSEYDSVNFNCYC
ncbi:hypothetical protein Tco_1579932, partial [Tanacetum coccineum]